MHTTPKIPSPHQCGIPDAAGIDKWRPGQVDALEFLRSSKVRVKAICAPTGTGKCFGRGTLLLRSDGTTVPVEAISIGDSLMGPDSTPRVVTSICEGYGPLYVVSPTKGESHIVNEEHTLVVVFTGGAGRSAGQRCDQGGLVDVPLREYLAETRTYKHCAKLQRVGVSYRNVDTPLDAYFLGLWLGDGSTGYPTITTVDREIVRYLRQFGATLGLGLSETPHSRGACSTFTLTNGRNGGRVNPLTARLREAGVLYNKHIPLQYQATGEETRLALLAGLLDSDGHLEGCGFEFVNKSFRLAQDVTALSRSLGLAAYLRQTIKSDQHGTAGTYYRVSISGDTHRIPTKVERKRAPLRRQIKSPLRVGFTVTPIGAGAYFGFSLSGPDQRCLLSDYTVTHNSLIAVGDALLSKKPTVIVTHSRALQDQYLETFRDAGMVDLRGRSNYPCHHRTDVPNYTCEHGHAAGCPNKGRYDCPASAAELRAGTSRLVVTNYEKWIHSRKYGIGLQHIEKVIFDEGHESFPALANAMQVTLSHHEVEHLLKMDFPDAAEAQFFACWREWAGHARAVAQREMKKAQAKMAERDPKASHVRNFTHLRNLVRRLSILSTANPLNWVVDELTKGYGDSQKVIGYQFDPVHPGRYLESALLLKVPDVTFMSATLTMKTLFMIGIGKALFEMRDYPSEFDPKRCPIYYVPTMKVDSKASSLQPLWHRLDQFAMPRRDRNGLVQSVSFARRDDAVMHSRALREAADRNKLFYNQRGESPTETIEQFTRAYPGAILISPSIAQGFDFKWKRAEYQFISKIPFPPPSKVLTARCDPHMGGDPEHAMYLTWQKLVQMAGRVMRDHRDRGETLIADDNLVWFMRYRHLAPRSFGQFFQAVQTLPPPPERLSADL